MTTSITFNKEVEQKAKELMQTHLGKNSVSGLYSFLVLKLWNEEKNQLVKFGNHLLSKEREESFKETTELLKKEGFNLPPKEDRLTKVHDSDVDNFNK